MNKSRVLFDNIPFVYRNIFGKKKKVESTAPPVYGKKNAWLALLIHIALKYIACYSMYYISAPVTCNS